MGRFKQKLLNGGLWDNLLIKINESLELRDLKLTLGKYAVYDATLVSSSRRLKKHYDTYKTDESDYDVDMEQLNYSLDK